MLTSVSTSIFSTCLNWIFWVVDILSVDFEIRVSQIQFQPFSVALDRRSTIVYIEIDRICKVLIQPRRYLQLNQSIYESYSMTHTLCDKPIFAMTMAIPGITKDTMVEIKVISGVKDATHSEFVTFVRFIFRSWIEFSFFITTFFEMIFLTQLWWLIN